MADAAQDGTPPDEGELVLFETEGPLAWITLNRPRYRNAQNAALTYALDDAFARFAGDDDLAVAILGGAGDHFSAGHDIGSPGVDYEETVPDRRTLWWDHAGKPGADRTMAREEEIYLGLFRRWRELPKPTIAMVQGACLAGALPLVWACDLIVAADDAYFAEPLMAMGVPGVEVFKHPWEVGPRQAKELLFTGEPISAERARELGMVNRVVPRGELRERTADLAGKIAEMPRFALALAKKAVNAAEDAMGQHAAMDSAFALHQLAHVQNELETGSRTKSKQVGDVRKLVEGEQD
jgi:enoyl-CoA hydratase/carnithine racemase